MYILTLHRSRTLALASAVLLTAACGDDKGSTDGSTSNATPATTSATATESAGTSATDVSSATDSPTTASPTSEPTSEPTTNPTTDPTAGGDGKFCDETCTVDADCKAMGMDLGFTCKDGHCAGANTGGCEADIDCEVLFSGWVKTCATQAECPGQVCIDIGGGAGRCALAPSDVIMCDAFMQSEIMLPPIEGGAPIAVCANTDYTCKDSVCTNPCMANTDCAAQLGHPQCNAGTGVCECTSDDDCKNAGVAGYGACHDGVCGCGSDADCTGDNTDVCNANGFCGCSDDAVCTKKAFDGTMSACQSL